MKTKTNTLLGAGFSLLVIVAGLTPAVTPAASIKGWGRTAMITLVGLAPPVAGQMIDLGTLGGDSSEAWLINDAGDVVGYSELMPGSHAPQQAFLYRNGQMTALSLGGERSYFIALNEAGDVLGGSDTIEGMRRAFLCRNGVMIELSFGFGQDSSYAKAMNEAGDVVGVATMALPADPWSNQESHAFLYRNGVMNDLGTLGGGLSSAYAINEAGDVVGISELAGGDYHAFLCPNGGAMFDIGDFVPIAINEAGDILGSSVAGTWAGDIILYRNGQLHTLTLGGDFNEPIAMNEAGDVIGCSTLLGVYQHAFVYRNDTIIELTFGGKASRAFAINEAGDVIGVSDTPSGTGARGFIYRNGQMIDLTLPGGYSSYPVAINEAGDVIGRSTTSGYEGNQAFLYRNGQLIDLGNLGGWERSWAIAINEAGDVIGYFTTAGYEGTHAFVYRDGQLIDLGTLGGDSSRPRAINEAGDIVGIAHTGIENHAFLFPAADNTPQGVNVVVQPNPAVAMTFDEVTTPGETTVTTSTSGPTPPSGFKLGAPPTYYEVTTTATYSGNIDVCFDYSNVAYGNELTLALYHHNGSSWIDVTTYRDTVNDIICGTVSSLSPFIIVELDNQPPEVTCNGPVVLWSPDHELVDVSSAISVSDPDGDPVTLTFRVFSDETEVPDTGDGTGRHAPDFKTELASGAHGVFVRSERRGPEDGRFYLGWITADDGRGGVTEQACVLAVCPHDQTQESLDDVLVQAAVAAIMVQTELDSGGMLPPAGLYEHGLSDALGPKQ